MEGILYTKDYKHFEIRACEGQDPEPIAAFEGAQKAGRAFTGQKVRWDGEIACAMESASEPLFLVGTLELKSKVRYGMTSRGSPLYSFIPFSEAYPPFFVGCSQKDTGRNLLTKVQFAHWSSDSTCPHAVLVQTYGPAGDLSAEEAALLDHYAPVRWTGRCTTDMAIPPPLEPELPLNCFPIPAFHIDPPGCRDIDDAITLHQEAGVRLGIHIADVASWLTKHPALLEKGLKIGQTLYKDGAAVRPLFPPQYSEGTLSLLPGKVRRALTLWCTWIPAAKTFDPDSFTWEHTWIRVEESYTYESIYASDHAYTLQEITSALAGYKVEDSHGWIEQLMILYNGDAARLLVEHGVGVLRRHAAPDAARLESLESIGLGEAARYLAMRGGEYCDAKEEQRGHWGLGMQEYCQVSSPIRRCGDGINQMALMKILGYLGSDVGSPIAPFHEVIRMLNEHAKRAKAYERDVLFLRALLNVEGAKIPVNATVVSADRVWIHEWKRLTKWKALATVAAAPGTELSFQVYCDPGQRNWKRRMVLQVLEIKSKSAGAMAPKIEAERAILEKNNEIV